MTVVGYAFEEAWVSLKRSGRSALVSIGTIAIAFLTLGGFLLVSVNVQRALDRWLEAAEMSVYLLDTASDDATHCDRDVPASAAEVSRPLNTFRRNARWSASARISRSCAMSPRASARIRFPRRSKCACAPRTPATPRPTDWRVTLPGGLASATSATIAQWLARLVGLVRTARFAAGLVAAILMLGAAFTVAAVVRLSLYARRDELEIMQLVGAPVQLHPRTGHRRGLAAGRHWRRRGADRDCDSVFDAGWMRWAPTSRA